METGRKRARPIPEHGTIARYAHRGCRCEACRAANAARLRAQRRKRHQATAAGTAAITKHGAST